MHQENSRRNGGMADSFSARARYHADRGDQRRRFGPQTNRTGLSARMNAHPWGGRFSARWITFRITRHPASNYDALRIDGWAKQFFQCLDVFGKGLAAG